MAPDKVVVGRRMVKRLEEIGMSKAEFARRVGTSAQNAGKWFHGKALASVEWWPGICSVLETEIDVMLAPTLGPEREVSEPPTTSELELLEELLEHQQNPTPEMREHTLKAIRRGQAAAEAEIRRRAASSSPPKRTA